MVDDELRAPVEQTAQRLLPFVGVEGIVLVDPDPRQSLPLPRQLVATLCEFLLRREQFEPRTRETRVVARIAGELLDGWLRTQPRAALRLLGVGKGIPPEAFRRFVPLMWIGLWMNLLTGIALLIGYPTKALTNPVFYLKLGLIAIGLAILRAIFRRTGSGHAAMGITKVLAAALLIAWIATITAGRLLAYTYTWLSVDSVRR